ncbi:thiolase family protein [Neobacillus massiliamazoniensis]|uniref:acetyl-CoA C-acetyltransferase n=1 Tax=Neobacillus massiliamazoniensis TaxID=1499688 RepID=A0A0U1NY78_9BACI|nr:acetyl-CoA C-acetyltransferase [Neobacillus massiliamazoniensis]CRK82957.1 acetyl-CoA acetyltransferase [Neobacillus massiliamazoniensis]
MENVYLVEALRTPIGSFGGSLKDVGAVQLATEVMKEVWKRSSLSGECIDEVVLGNVLKSGVKGNPARQAAIHAGIPVSVPAMTIDKQCASGLRAITLAYHQIQAGESNVVIAGGTESMSNVPHLVLNARWGQKMGDLRTVDALFHDGLHCAIEGYHMGITAENLVERYQISREEQDVFALDSQIKALKAREQGKFQEEIIPIQIKTKQGTGIFTEDESIKNTNLGKLHNLKPAFKENGTVTAGNSSGLNDGAAAVIVASEQAVKEYNLKPLAKIRSVASAAVAPSIMGIGPVPATQKALERANLTIQDIELAELNEAFAAQVLAVNKELCLPEEIINVNGGAIALGHPIGCSGARIVVTLVHELRRQKKQIGLASLCVGGGQGVSIIVEAI